MENSKKEAKRPSVKSIATGTAVYDGGYVLPAAKASTEIMAMDTVATPRLEKFCQL